MVLSINRVATVCLLVGAITCSATSAAVETVEEHLIYSLHWGLISVGEAELKTGTKALPSGGAPVPYSEFVVRTSGVADKLFKVRTKIEAWSDPESGQPLLYMKEQREGKTERDIELYFDWEANTVEYWRNGERREPLPIPEAAVDPLSLLLILRASAHESDEPSLYTATDGKRIVQIGINPVGEKTVRTGRGRVAAQKYSVSTRELEGVFEKSPDASIELWFSNDDRRYPVRMESEVIVGSFHGTLQSVEGVEWEPPRSEVEATRPGGHRKSRSR